MSFFKPIHKLKIGVVEKTIREASNKGYDVMKKELLHLKMRNVVSHLEMKKFLLHPWSFPLPLFLVCELD